MQRSSAKRRIGSYAPTAAIVLNQGSQGGGHSRAGFFLVFFMRFVAALLIIDGLLEWNSMLATTIDGRSLIMSLSSAETTTTIFFAIIDLIASVGLWLATPWGGVIWLVSAGAQLLVLFLLPGFYSHPWLTGFTDLVLVSLYMVLTWHVAAAAQGPSP